LHINEQAIRLSFAFHNTSQTTVIVDLLLAVISHIQTTTLIDLNLFIYQEGYFVDVRDHWTPISSFLGSDLALRRIAYHPPNTVLGDGLLNSTGGNAAAEGAMFDLELVVYDDRFAASEAVRLSVYVRSVPSVVVKSFRYNLVVTAVDYSYDIICFFVCFFISNLTSSQEEITEFRNKICFSFNFETPYFRESIHFPDAFV